MDTSTIDDHFLGEAVKTTLFRRNAIEILTRRFTFQYPKGTPVSEIMDTFEEMEIPCAMKFDDSYECVYETHYRQVAVFGTSAKNDLIYRFQLQIKDGYLESVEFSPVIGTSTKY